MPDSDDNVVSANTPKLPSFYISDGDLVVSAALKSDQNTVLFFRIHKAFLAFHSPIFKDMFNIGDVSTSEMHDGVPRVHLPDDAEDVAGFLQALHDPTCVLDLRRDACSH